MYGKRFTFTPEEESTLQALAQRLSARMRSQKPGWRVRVISDVTEMHATIAKALTRRRQEFDGDSLVISGREDH